MGLSGKKNSPALMKKGNIGIKVNAKPPQNRTTSEIVASADKETVSRSDETQDTSTSTSNTSTGTKLNNAGNGLSLLGAYSGSSDNDSDQ